MEVGHGIDARSVARVESSIAREKRIRLRKAADESKGEIEGLRGNVGELQEAIAGHAFAIQQYKMQLRAQEDEARSLMQELQLSRSEVEDLTVRLKVAEDARQQAEDARRKSAAAEAEAAEAGRTKESRIKELLHRAESAEAELSIVTQRHRNAESECSNLRRQLLAAEAAKDASAKRAESMAQQAASLEAELGHLQRSLGEIDRCAADHARAKHEAEGRVSQAEAGLVELRDKLSRAEGTIAELRREGQECDSLKAQLMDLQRRLATVSSEKAALASDLTRAETALGEALSDTGSLESLRAELSAVTSKLETANRKQMSLDTTRGALESEVGATREALRTTERRAIEAERKAAAQANETRMVAERCREAEEERDAYREEARRWQSQCDELAAGVNRLNTALEKEEHMRLEAVRERELALKAKHLDDMSESPVLLRERSAAAAEIRELAAMLDLVWRELGHLVLPDVSPGAPPADGDFDRLIPHARRRLQAADSMRMKLRELTTKYLGVLGSSARRRAEAAMNAPDTDDDVDDIEVVVKLLMLILDKLMDDMTQAQRIITQQNTLLRSASAGVERSVLDLAVLTQKHSPPRSL